ncbi:MAG TPA: phospho-sugar mutase [Bacteroidales bacterium]|nr:phospho-sugar mutase [Bacteroidales bacterium]
MENVDLLTQVKKKANGWLEGDYDKETKEQVRNLLENNEKELIDAFYKDLEFGTGGLRGIMGVGTNRMNIYTVGTATQGLSNYLHKQFSGLSQIKAVIAYDSRNNSRLFAEKAASVLSANGIYVYLFDKLKPTPELSFAIRHLSCQAGIVITASHNPKEYNGYKVYWEDGGQIISPHDKNIINEVQKIQDISEVNFNGNDQKIESIGENIDQVYLDQIKTLSLNPDIIGQQKDLKIVFTPLHGTGVDLVPRALEKIGFTNVIHVPEQDEINGDFPTVHSPNPEEHAALKMALDKAEETDADLVMATDPDADRVGIAVRNKKGQLEILNGNQAASLLINYLLSQWKNKGKLSGKEYIVKTIVTTELLADIAEAYGVDHYDTLTGFKYIAHKIKQLEGSKTFIAGGEESYGYLAGDFVRDKDAVISCALLAETTAFAKANGNSLFDQLIDIYMEHGFFKEKLLSIVKHGKEGEEEIRQMMDQFRNNPPDSINGQDLMLIHDYTKQKTMDLMSHLRYDIKLPKANVLQFILKDGSKISLRPSGTEPKIKFYFSVNDKLDKRENFEKVDKMLEERIDNIINALNIK